MPFASTKRPLFEPLEARRLLAGDPWGLAPRLIGQDDVAASYPDLTGGGQTIAVIDTGIDYNHPLLGGGFGDGFKVVDGWDFVDNDADPMDTYGHGTRVAGVLAADEFTHGGFTHRGVAPDAKLVALRIDESNAPVPDERIEAALDWVLDHRAEHGITVVNISFGFGSFDEPFSSSVFGDELRALDDAGVFVVASSGNNGVTSPPGIQYPAVDDNVLSVGSVSEYGTISEFTQRSADLDMLAPGESMPTTDRTDGLAGTPDITTASGTSFATPVVAGAAALLRQADPGMTLHDLRSVLTASSVENLDGDDEFGNTTTRTFAQLDLFAAVSLAHSRRPGLLGATSEIGEKANYNDMAVDDEGVLHFVYYDAFDQDLKYASRNRQGFWSNRTTVDAGQYAGMHLSLAVDAFGRPSVAYYHGGIGDLKLATFDGVDWNVEVVDWKHSTGLYPSLTYDHDDRPVVAFFYKQGSDLRVYRKESAGWRSLDVDADPLNEDHKVGRSTSIAVDEQGRVGVGYVDSRNGDLMFARESTAGGSWKKWRVDDTTVGGIAWTSVGFDGDNRPVVSYYDGWMADLRFARLSGGDWSTQVLATKSAQGLYDKLVVDTEGQVNIVYYNRYRNATMIATETYSGGWVHTPLKVGGGKFISADIRDDGMLSYAWYNTDSRVVNVHNIEIS